MKLKEHIEQIRLKNHNPRIVEHETKNGLMFVAWTPTREGPARFDYPAAFADLNDMARGC